MRQSDLRGLRPPMRGGETFEAAVQDVMNRTSWLRDYFEDYMFKTQRELTGNDGREQTGVGKGAGRGKNRQMPVRNGLPHAHAEEHRDASNYGHRNVPRGYAVLRHRRGHTPRTDKPKTEVKKKQACLEFQKGRCVTQGSCLQSLLHKCTVCDRTGWAIKAALARPRKPAEEGKRENRAFNAQVSCFDRVCLTSDVTHEKEIELCVRSVLFCVIELFGDRTDSYDIKSTQAGPRRLPERPSILLQHLWEKSAQAVQPVIVLVTASTLVGFARDSTGPRCPSSARLVPDDEFCLPPTGAGVQEPRRRRSWWWAVRALNI